MYLKFRYTCIWPKKLIISKSDLASKLEVKIVPVLSITCQADGTYNVDATLYTCTKPCPLPRVSSPDLMFHNWTNTTDNTEYKDTIK